MQMAGTQVIESSPAASLGAHQEAAENGNRAGTPVQATNMNTGDSSRILTAAPNA